MYAQGQVTELLTIGEVAEQAGVATSALRYYDELGLLPPATRVSGQRRYRPEAVAQVGVILLLTDVSHVGRGGDALASRAESPQAWHALAEAKVDELRDEARPAHGPHSTGARHEMP